MAQTKSYRNIERQVIPIAGVNNQTIQNLSERKENFHGIRFKGRIISDDLVEGFSSGFITLMCLPTAAEAVPIVDQASKLDDINEYVIAAEPWMILNPGAGTKDNAHTFSGYDFDIVITGTSRTCNRGGRIIAQVHNDGTSVNLVVVNSLLSTFRTIT